MGRRNAEGGFLFVERAACCGSARAFPKQSMMIDIHCHILPRIDDGPEDIGTSLRMAEIAAADGITHLVATPHFTYDERPAVSDIGRRVDDLRNRLDESGLSLKLLAGADIRLTYELVEGLQRKDVPTIDGSRYFLLELPDILPPNLNMVFFAAESNGYAVIITHPERNYSLLSSPQRVEGLRDAGVLFQLTAMSVTGEFGDLAKQFSHMLLKKGYADFVATDAHNNEVRVPVLSKARREVSRLLGGKRAERIFMENPADVLADREIRAA